MQSYLHMIRRSFWIDRVERAWEHRSLVWLSGVRRVGKTTLTRMLDDVEYFDCDEPGVRRELSDPETFWRAREGRRVVLDEVHRLDEPSQALKIATDHFPSTRVVATGSSTLQASAKFKDALTGRKVEVWLTPMMSADLEEFGGSLDRRLARGGLPPFYMPQALPVSDFQEWMDSYWARDIQELFRLEKRASFLKLVELVLARSGGMFEATAYATPCEVSRPTIANYLAVLEATRVAHVVRPYSTRRSTEIVSMPKVYAFDTGFVAEYRGWRDPRPEELGVLWEHYVLNEIHARAPWVDVRYWRDTRHHEVDFVVAPRGGSPVAIECKWSARTLDRLDGMRAFRRAYEQGRNLVVAADVQRSYPTSVDGLSVEVVTLPDLVDRVAEAIPELRR